MTVLRSLVLACGLLISGVGAIGAAYGESAVAGVNVVNPQRLSATDRQKVLDQLQAAGVHLIRAPLIPGRVRLIFTTRVNPRTARGFCASRILASGG